MKKKWPSLWGVKQEHKGQEVTLLSENNKRYTKDKMKGKFKLMNNVKDNKNNTTLASYCNIHAKNKDPIFPSCYS